jgi:hypothetical protein
MTNGWRPRRVPETLWQWKSKLERASTRLFLAGKRKSAVMGKVPDNIFVGEMTIRHTERRFEEKRKVLHHDCIAEKFQARGIADNQLAMDLHVVKEGTDLVAVESRFSYNDAYIEVSTTVCRSLSLSHLDAITVSMRTPRARACPPKTEVQ